MNKSKPLASDNSKTALVDLIKAIVAVTALPLTVYTIISILVEKPGITLAAALVTGIVASILVVKYQNVRVNNVITAWLILIVIAIAGWILWPKTITVEGIVIDVANNPVPNEEVKLIDANGTPRITNTSNTGHYQFRDIPNGQYEIVVRGNKVEGLAQSGFVLVLTLNLTAFQPTATPTSTMIPKDTAIPSPTYAPTSTPTPTPTADSSDLRLEAMPLYAFGYGGDGDPNVGAGSARLSITQTQRADIDYVLEYLLPDTGAGYAGVAFRFSEPQDLSGYEFVEITIIFGDDQTSCDLNMRDIADNRSYFRLGEVIPPGAGITVSVNGNEQVIKIPLEGNFDSVNLKVIKEIGCNAGTHFTRGRHTFTIREIHFLKR